MKPERWEWSRCDHSARAERAAETAQSVAHPATTRRSARHDGSQREPFHLLMRLPRSPRLATLPLQAEITAAEDITDESWNFVGLPAGNHQYIVFGVNSRGSGPVSAISTVPVAAQAVA